MSRRAWAIVPAKSTTRAKSRLEPVLGDDERAAFARALLGHVLEVLAGSGLDGILVATDGDDVADLARARGAAVLRDEGAGALAEVADRALAEVDARGAEVALVLMADLPRVTAEDVARLLAAADDHDVVAVRDQKGRHTNALVLAPPTAMRTSFGQSDSFGAHCAAARAAGLRLAVLDLERVAFDVDGPEDLAGLELASAALLGDSPRGGA